MVYLKEDGSLDIDKINNLPMEEYIEVVGDMTLEEYKYYTSKLPINEGNQPVRPVLFYSIEELFENDMGFDLKEYLNNWKKEQKCND